MEPALQRRVQRYGWDKAAAHYEIFWQQQLKPAQDTLLAMAALQPGEKVIDIACGTGLVSFPALQKVGQNGSVLANDISDGMVKVGKEIAAAKGYTNIQFERMDAEELQVADAIYDVALDALGLMYVPDPVKALKEMYRVLKPDGRAVAAVWGQRDHCGWSAVFEIVDRRVKSEVCPLFFHLGTGEMLQKQFEFARFNNITAERISTELIYHSAQDACGAAFAGGSVALAYNKFPEHVKEEAHVEYLESIKQYRKGNGYAVPGEFLIVKGIK